jgi:uncharacterized membrane protein
VSHLRHSQRALGAVLLVQPGGRYLSGKPNEGGYRRERLLAYLRSSWPWILLVAGIVVLATGLRIWDLSKQGLWFDEVWSVSASMHGPVAAIKATALDTNPPLFYILEALAIQVFGRSDAAVRIVPAFLGVLSTACMYLAGRKLFNRPTGAWAAALFAVSSIAVQYAQEARMYSQLMFFSALLLWAFALLLERPTTTRAFGMGLVLACLAYTHVFGYMVAPMLLISVVLIPRLRSRVARQTLIACVVALVLFLPWVFALPAQIGRVQSGAAKGAWWMKPPGDLWKVLTDNVIAFAPGNLSLPAIIFATLLIVGVAALPIAASARTRLTEEEQSQEASLSYLLFALAVLPPLLGILISKYVTPVYSLRNTLVSLPAAYMLVAHGGVKLRKPFGYMALLLLLVFGLLSHPQKYPHTAKGEWLRAAELVAAESDAAVLTESYSVAVTLETYPKLHDRTGSPNVLWASDVKAKPAAKGMKTSGSEMEIPTFLSGFNKVYAVSTWQSNAAADYMDTLPDWKFTGTEKIYRPVMRVYTRVK